ncbi:transglutaminase domain-containing protein [Candidatus Micrarchaeota archaeon]|nr:transglutaminase domain-containing protein [Candidatus Micrarchaeota archaeon]
MAARRIRIPATEDHYSSKENRIYFATSLPDKFSAEKVIDMTSVYAKEGNVKRLPCGAFIFAPRSNLSGEALDLATVFSAISLNLVGPGFLIPSGILGEEWKFSLPLNEEDLLLHLEAINLMVITKIKHVSGQNEFVGNAQPLMSLKTGEGTCYERAGILAAVFRSNGIAARVKGNANMIPFGPPIQQHHWWVEAKVGGKWKCFDPNFHPLALKRMAEILDVQDSSHATPTLSTLMTFMGPARFVQFAKTRNLPLFIVDEPRFSAGRESANVAPEMELPKKYSPPTDRPVF